MTVPNSEMSNGMTVTGVTLNFGGVLKMYLLTKMRWYFRTVLKAQQLRHMLCIVFTCSCKVVHRLPHSDTFYPRGRMPEQD